MANQPDDNTIPPGLLDPDEEMETDPSVPSVTDADLGLGPPDVSTSPSMPSVTDADIGPPDARAAAMPTEPGAEAREKQGDDSPTEPGGEAPAPNAEEHPSTARSMRSVTAFDLASQPNHRALPDTDSPEEVWASNKSLRLEDHAPDHEELRVPSGVDLEDELGPEMDEPPKPRPRYVTQAAAPAPTPAQLSRRRVLRWSAIAGVGGLVGWQAWGRRPVALTIDFKPSVLTRKEFGTLLHACEAMLGDADAAARAAMAADQRFQWLGADASARLSANLRSLEMGAGGLLDSRRFSRLDVEEARELLQEGAGSSLAARRRVSAELDYIARWYWASHPETADELRLPDPTRG